MDDLIVRTVTRMIVPFIQAYGIYIVLYGHLSPGGGFSGGAIIGSSLMLYTIVFGVHRAEKKFSHHAAEIAESGGILVFAGLGLVGMIVAGNFLANRTAGFPLGEPGALLSAGMIPIVMIAIGIKVASTMITLFRALIETEDPS